MGTCGTVTVLPAFDPDQVSVSCSMDASEIEVGEVLNVDYTVGNDNDASASVDVAVTADGSVVDTVSETVPGGSSRTGTFAITFDDPSSNVSVGTELTTVEEA